MLFTEPYQVLNKRGEVQWGKWYPKPSYEATIETTCTLQNRERLVNVFAIIFYVTSASNHLNMRMPKIHANQPTQQLKYGKAAS